MAKSQKVAPLFKAQFGGYTLENDKLWQSSRGWDITGASATFDAEPSNKSPSVGRAFLGIIAGGAVGALFGFVIVGGGIITVAVCAVVIGLVMGLTPTEKAKTHVTLTYANGAPLVMEEPTEKWEHARYMAQEITKAGQHYGTTTAPPTG